MLLLIVKPVSSKLKYDSIHDNANSIKFNLSNSYYSAPKENATITLDYSNCRDLNFIQ